MDAQAVRQRQHGARLTLRCGGSPGDDGRWSLLLFFGVGTRCAAPRRRGGNTQVECVGSFDSGVEAVRWAPDEELLAVIGGDGKLLLLTKDYDVLVEVDIDSKETGEDTQVRSWQEPLCTPAPCFATFAVRPS